MTGWDSPAARLVTLARSGFSGFNPAPPVARRRPWTRWSLPPRRAAEGDHDGACEDGAGAGVDGVVPFPLPRRGRASSPALSCG